MRNMKREFTSARPVRTMGVKKKKKNNLLKLLSSERTENKKTRGKEFFPVPKEAMVGGQLGGLPAE